MVQELKKFYATLENERAEVLNTDIEGIVAERVAKLTEKVRAEVREEVVTNASVLAIKMEAIADAIKVVETATQPTVEVIEEHNNVEQNL